eukprot:536419-Amphidinium_carterae.1
MREILKGVWEILRQPSVNAERTRRCQTGKCWHLSLMTNSGFRNSSLDWMLRETPSASIGKDCLQEDLCGSLEDCWTQELSISDEEDFTWEGLCPTRRPLAFHAWGFASEQEFYCTLANHVKEVDEDLASHATPCLKGTSRAKLSWRRTKTGMRRARRVGPGVTIQPLHCRRRGKRSFP